MSGEEDPRSVDDEELATLFRAMRDDRVPEDLEDKLLTALAVGGAAWAVKSGFFATLFAKLFAATKGSAAATALGIGLAAAGSLAAVRIIATQTAPRSFVEPTRGLAPATSRAERGEPTKAPTLTATIPPEAATAAASAAASAPASVGPRGSAPARDTKPSADPAPSTPAIAPPAQTVAEPTADVLREEAGRVRAVADLVAAGRCGEANAAVQAYRAAFPRGQLAQEMRVLEARCAPAK